MEKIIFECETITPMFLAGADGVTPELRAPSIKGALRFWWRALHGHLPLADLKTQEAKIFGGTEPARRSMLTLKAINFPSISDLSVDYPTPHNKNFPKKAISTGFLFNIQLGISKQDIFTVEYAKALFILFSIFGSLGNRSRRGFGSLKINKINGELFKVEESKSYILELITKVSPSFKMHVISPTSKYPYLRDFIISQKKYTLIDIGQATHDVMFNDDTSNNKEEYKATLGAGAPRFSSPVYISCLPSGHLIISKLNTQSPNMTKVNIKLSDALIKKLT